MSVGGEDWKMIFCCCLVIGNTLVLTPCDPFKVFQFIWCCLWRGELSHPSACVRPSSHRVTGPIGALVTCIRNKLHLLMSVLMPELHQESWEIWGGFALFISIIALERKDSYPVPFSLSCSSMPVYVCVLIHVAQSSCSCLLIFSSQSQSAKEQQIQCLQVA